MLYSAPLKSNSKKIMILGSGELGKELIIEAQRLGLETIAVDKYENAPAHNVAHRSYVVDMQNKDALLEIMRREKPDYILPEIEAISIEALFEAEKEGLNIIPNADAVSKTMNRKNIRTFADKVLKVKTGPYEFVKTIDELREASKRMGYPCVIKPVMSSSGHGQSVLKCVEDVSKSWEIAKEARGDASELIVEAFVDFDYEITMLTARNGKETIFCEPIGHEQLDGDYVFSWQPCVMSELAKQRSQEMAKIITDGLGGRGIFGVELFIKNDEVYFSEVSPRPHDTGMVTLITQSQSEFALHIRAVLGLPLGFTFYGEGVSAAFKSEAHNYNPVLDIDDDIFTDNSIVRVFSKPEAHKGRRLAVVLVFDKIKIALSQARELIKKIKDV